MSHAKEDFWFKYISSKSGKPYYFNAATKVTQYEVPKSGTVIDKSKKPSKAPSGKPVEQTITLANLQAGIKSTHLSSKQILSLFSDKVDSYIQQIGDSTGLKCLRFPAGLDADYQYIISEAAEIAELEIEVFGLPGERYSVVWQPGYTPEEVETAEREKEERQKLIEIEKKRKREDAEERRKQAKQWRDEERATAMARSADAAVAQTNDFKRRDRRHIEDLQQELEARSTQS